MSILKNVYSKPFSPTVNAPDVTYPSSQILLIEESIPALDSKSDIVLLYSLLQALA